MVASKSLEHKSYFSPGRHSQLVASSYMFARSASTIRLITSAGVCALAAPPLPACAGLPAAFCALAPAPPLWAGAVCVLAAPADDTAVVPARALTLLAVPDDPPSGLLGVAADRDDVCELSAGVAASFPPQAAAQISRAMDNLSVMRGTVTCGSNWSDSRLRTRVLAKQAGLYAVTFL
jgi:hypothetical protein